MGQSMFIVWRESVEALLVIGILHAPAASATGCRQRPAHALAGVAAGLGPAGALGWGVLQAGDWLAGSGGEWFQCAMLLVASLLILHMVGWMHQHGRTLKTSLQNSAADKLSQGSGFGLLVLAMLAVGREGSETVVFLYGIGNQQQGRTSPASSSAEFWALSSPCSAMPRCRLAAVTSAGGVSSVSAR